MYIKYNIYKNNTNKIAIYLIVILVMGVYSYSVNMESYAARVRDGDTATCTEVAGGIQCCFFESEPDGSDEHMKCETCYEGPPPSCVTDWDIDQERDNDQVLDQAVDLGAIVQNDPSPKSKNSQTGSTIADEMNSDSDHKDAKMTKLPTGNKDRIFNNFNNSELLR